MSNLTIREIQASVSHKLFTELTTKTNYKVCVTIENLPEFENEFDPGKVTYHLCMLDVTHSQDPGKRWKAYYYLVADKEHDLSKGTIIVDSDHSDNVSLGSYEAAIANSLLTDKLTTELNDCCG